MRKNITISSYQSQWPEIFNQEAAKIRNALGDNCLEIHHVGSTSVPGLTAKPIIDMIVVIKTRDAVVEPLEKLGLQHKGEYNIPMRLYFSRTEEPQINLHVYEEGHPEIELNLLFRDYLRSYPEARDEYAALKTSLLQDQSSYEKKDSSFTGYNLGKDAFIRKILKSAGYNQVRIMRCTHYAEWEAAKAFRQNFFFTPAGIQDPYTWTFNHPEHVHLILYQGVDIAGYLHVQIWPEHRAALRILVIDPQFRNRGLGSRFLALLEQWLKTQGIRSIHDEARPESLSFYRQCGYVEMPFNDPSGEPPSDHDIAMGKRL